MRLVYCEWILRRIHFPSEVRLSLERHWLRAAREACTLVVSLLSTVERVERVRVYRSYPIHRAWDFPPLCFGCMRTRGWSHLRSGVGIYLNGVIDSLGDVQHRSAVNRILISGSFAVPIRVLSSQLTTVW